MVIVVTLEKVFESHIIKGRTQALEGKPKYMVNLFRLLGLPDPSKPTTPSDGRSKRSADPGPQKNDSFHDLGEPRWADRTRRMKPPTSRFLHYIKPDDLHRMNLDGMEERLSSGDLIIADLSSLTHMPSQQEVCRRRIQSLGGGIGLPVFALNESDTILMIAGSKMRVDTEKHMLGMAMWSQLSEDQA
tara:strand:+ start:23817 stop:24380 length:564 start_codon:yes stop_codon:yes gene_type:complete